MSDDVKETTYICAHLNNGFCEHCVNQLREELASAESDAAAWRALQGVEVEAFEKLLYAYGNAAIEWNNAVDRQGVRNPLHASMEQSSKTVVDAFRTLTAERDAAKAANAELRFHLNELVIDVTNATTESEKSDALAEAQRFLERTK